ncbi:MAG: YciI family protein [Pseudomonadota bacterium]
MDFDSYRETARGRGAMAFEVFLVLSRIADAEKVPALLPDHLAYIAELERSGALMMAGPLSDPEGREVAGGCLVLRAADMAAARALADGDPMHAGGARSYELRRWLINEGGATVTFGFSTGPARLG